MASRGCVRRSACSGPLLKQLSPRSVEEFHRQADPDRENLCLYGTNDGNWVVDLPAEEVPPEVPEPALGINFARDGMQVRRHNLLACGVESRQLPFGALVPPLCF